MKVRLPSLSALYMAADLLNSLHGNTATPDPHGADLTDCCQQSDLEDRKANTRNFGCFACII